MADKTKSLDVRISQSLQSNGSADRDMLASLLDESFDEIGTLEELIKIETPHIMDLSNTDPDKSTMAVTSAKLRIERLTLAIPQLQQRIAAIDAETALKECNKEADRHRAESDKIYDELKEIYPPFLKKMMEMFYKGRANAAAFNELKRRAPDGADLKFAPAMPYDSFWLNLRLPSWNNPGVIYPERQTPEEVAWAQQVAFTNAAVAQAKAIDLKFAPHGGQDWHEVQKNRTGTSNRCRRKV